MGAATDAANEAMGFTNSQVWSMANEAENIINTKYGEELGRLDDLTASIEPTLQTISLEDATFSESLFSKVQADGGKVVQMTQALPAPGIVVPVDAGQPSDAYSSFIRN
jgi:5-formaminoimidazole-4-carboxamide-1-beta-D-ribofuranosyl 5'-monophosphate synthetase